MKRMLFVIVLLATIVALYADEEVEYIFYKYSWHPIVFAGGGTAWAPSTDTAIGLNLGAAVDIEYKDLKYGPILQLGIRYRTAGYSTESNLNIINSDYSLTLNSTSEMYAHYTDVFLKCVANFPWTPNLTVRPYLGWALGSIVTGSSEYSLDYTISGAVGDSKKEEGKSSFGLSEGWNMGTNTFLLGLDVLVKDFYYVGIEYNIGMGNPSIYLVHPATVEKNGVESDGNFVVPRLNNLMLNVGVRF